MESWEWRVESAQSIPVHSGNLIPGLNYLQRNRTAEDSKISRARNSHELLKNLCVPWHSNQCDISLGSFRWPIWLRKAPWSKWRNFDRPNLRNLTVQMDDGPMDHLRDVILDGPKLRSTTVVLDRPKLRLSGGPLDHRKFGRLSFVNLDGPNYAIWTKEPSSMFYISTSKFYNWTKIIKS